MWRSKPAFILSIFLITLLISSMHLVDGESLFSVSPEEFTVQKAPPMGKPWRIPQKLVVWNRDNVERLVFITTEIPPENAVRPGYQPIPNDNWVIPFPTSVLIPENSFAEVNISFDIPRWENLTGKKWEVWIPVERQALPGEIGTLRPTVRVKIETTEELPPLSEPPLPLYIALAIVAGAVISALGLWARSKRRSRKRLTLSQV
jgi:hypothetical protein